MLFYQRPGYSRLHLSRVRGTATCPPSRYTGTKRLRVRITWSLAVLENEKTHQRRARAMLLRDVVIAGRERKRPGSRCFAFRTTGWDPRSRTSYTRLVPAEVKSSDIYSIYAQSTGSRNSMYCNFSESTSPQTNNQQ